MPIMQSQALSNRYIDKADLFSLLGRLFANNFTVEVRDYS
jgi:hypothetical protein